MKTITPFVFQQFMFISGVKDKASFSYEEAEAWVWLLKINEGSETFLKIMRSFPRRDKATLTNQIRVVLGEEVELPCK